MEVNISTSTSRARVIYNDKDIERVATRDICSRLVYVAFHDFISKGREPWNIDGHVKESESC